MSNLIQQGANLTALAGQINEAHARKEAALEGVVKAAADALTHARDAGGLLLEAKAAVQHGEWLPWLQANVCFSLRTAQMYMKVSQGWEYLEAKCATVAHLGLRQAMALLTEWLADNDPEGESAFHLDDAPASRPAACHVSANTGMPEWYTPPLYLDAARRVLGRIDLDPASSTVAQEAVRAKTTSRWTMTGCPGRGRGASF
jgi:Protein of unknown function (DUF3102)